MRTPLLLAGLLVLILEPMVRAQKHPLELFREGREAFEHGDWGNCVEKMLEVVVQNPRDTESRTHLEACAGRLEQQRLSRISQARTLAVEGTERALESHRQDALLWLARIEDARRSRASGETLRALEQLRPVLEGNPDHAGAVSLMRELLWDIAKKLDEDTFSSAKEKHLFSAFFSYFKGNKNEASAEFSRALSFPRPVAELSDDEILAYVNRLKGLEAPQARTTSRKEVRKEHAAPRLDEWSLINRRAKELFRQAQSLRSAMKLEQALERLNELLALRPDYPEARELSFTVSSELKARQTQLRKEAEEHYQKGLAYYAKGESAKAKSEWEKCIAKDPEHSYAASALGRMGKDSTEAP